MNTAAIKVADVSKKYCRTIKHTMLYGATDILRSFFGLNSRSENLRNGEFWALDNISFNVNPGETLGIIGPNGSGKSTMLKMLNGIFMPDKGGIEINGRVGALIEVGAGFHPLLTGRENIYINGSILGMGKKEIDSKFNEIIRFADIGEFIDAPVKHYSSGMHVRLGFAIAVIAEPDILLVDEVLAVGDINFQMKCFRKIADLKEIGKTIILVTHDMSAIQRHTDRVVLLEKGKAIAEDVPKKIISRYLSAVTGDFNELPAESKNDIVNTAQKGFLQDNLEDDLCFKRTNYNKNEYRFGNGTARIVDFKLMDSEGRETVALKRGNPLLFRVKFKFYSYVQKPVFGVIVKTKKGVELFSNNTLHENTDVPPREKGDVIWVEYRVGLDFPPGEYLISAGVATISSDEVIPLDRRIDLVNLKIAPENNKIGNAHLNTSIRIYCEQNT